MVLTLPQLKALRLLHAAGTGSTVPALMRRGCTVDELHRLVRDGFARAEPMNVQDKRPSPADFYLRITGAGRKALARRTAEVVREVGATVLARPARGGVRCGLLAPIAGPRRRAAGLLGCLAQSSSSSPTPKCRAAHRMPILRPTAAMASARFRVEAHAAHRTGRRDNDSDFRGSVTCRRVWAL
jgi:hypothetical protein